MRLIFYRYRQIRISPDPNTYTETTNKGLCYFQKGFGYLIFMKVYNCLKCTKYETCATLHRFHILCISCDCDSEMLNVFFLIYTYFQLISTGLQLRVSNKNLIFLFLNQNICYGYSKEPSQWDSSFKYPKHMLKLMGKKIFTILR